MAQVSNRQKIGPWVIKPRGFPPGLYVHKKGWAMRLGPQKKVRIIAGKIQPQDALVIYYRKMALEVQQITVQMVQQSDGETPAITPESTNRHAALPVEVIQPVKQSLTVVELKDKYIRHKERLWRAGEFAPRSLMSIKEILPRFAEAYPGPYLSLTAGDFANYRDKLVARYSPTSLNRHVTNIRAMFSWAFRNHVIPDMPAWGDSFEKPPAKSLRKHREKMRQKHGLKLYEPEQIRDLLAAAHPQLKAMVLLGVNCAMGNTDVAQLPISVVNLKGKMVDFPRPKTGEARRAPLWPETVDAIKKVLATRPTPKDEANDHLLFLTQTGLPLVRENVAKGKNGTRIDYVTLWFRDLVKKVTLEQKGRGFYSLRHSFYTYGGQTTDRDAVSRIAGHSLRGMADAYCERITDDRLVKVSNYVREQIFGPLNDAVVVSSV